MTACVEAIEARAAWQPVSRAHHDDVDPARPGLPELASEVRERLRERARHPEQILEGRRRFYLRHGGACGPSVSTAGYGQSELAFTGWLLRRGSLGGPGRPRSLWWSGVNFDLAFYSHLAAAIVEHRLTDRADLPQAVRPWLAYLAHPSALTWYRAHNDSIVRSYLARAHEARSEPLLEQRFMGRVLIRVLCVQAIHELGDRLPVLARYADPRSNLVERVLGLRWLYPEPYPIAPWSFAGAAQSAVHVVETLLWRLGLNALFRAAAKWLALPALSSLVQSGQLLYPYLAEGHAALSVPGPVYEASGETDT